MDVYKQISSNNRQTVLILCLFFALVFAIAFIATAIMEVPRENFPTISLAIFSVLFLWTLISYYKGDKIILNFVKAKELTRKDHFEIYNMVENISITAGLPNPKVYIIEDESLNAFATGRNPNNSVICLTTGIIKKLDKRELEGVIAHEMGHIANYDIRLQLLTITVIGLVAIIGEIMMRARGKKSGGIVIAGLFIFIIGRGILSLIRLALSRNREYLADATGSFYTRDPEALALALEKISEDPRIESADTMTSAAQLFIANPKDEGKAKLKTNIQHQPSFFSTITATHPPIGSRINRLRNRG